MLLITLLWVFVEHYWESACLTMLKNAAEVLILHRTCGCLLNRDCWGPSCFFFFFFFKWLDKKLFRKVTIYHNPASMMYLIFHFCHFGKCLIANTRQKNNNKKTILKWQNYSFVMYVGDWNALFSSCNPLLFLDDFSYVHFAWSRGVKSYTLSHW